MVHLLLQSAEFILACLLGIAGGITWIFYGLWVIVRSLREDMT